MNKRDFKSTLMLIPLIIAFIIVLVSLYSIANIRIADRNIVSIYNDRVLPLEQLKSVSDGYMMDVIGISQKALYGKVSWDSTIQVLNKATVVINKNWSDYLDTYLTPEESGKVQQAKYLKIKADHEFQSLYRLLGIRNSQHERAFKQTVEDSLYQNIEPFTKKISELILIQTKEANNLKSLTEQVFHKIILLAIFAGIMCFLMIWIFHYKNSLEKTVRAQANELIKANEELNTALEELQSSNEALDATNEELYATNEEYSVLNDQLLTTNEVLEKHKNQLELLVAERVKDFKESESRYRILAENIMNPYIVSTFEGEVLFINQKGIEFIGIDRNQLPDFQSKELWVHPSQRTRVMEQIKEFGFIKNEEAQFYNQKGDIMTVIISSNLINYYGQQAFFSIFNDITDRKNAENSLQESEILYKTIIDSTTDLICSVDVPGFRMLTYNQELYDYHKMRKVHLEKGMTPADIFDPVNAGIWTGLYQKTMIEDHVYLLNYKSTTGDYIYNFSLHLLKHNSEPFAISVFGNNITENKKAEIALKESEERFRVTFEKAGIGIALVDMDGKPIRNNSKLQEMLGYSEEELSLMPFPLFTHPDDIDKDWEQYTELKKGKTDTYQIEKRYIRKDGGVVWGNLTVSLVRSPDGMPLHAIGMVEDITHKKQLDRQILNSVIKTEESERLNFSQELHDGLGPLISATKMYVQLLSIPNSKMKPGEIISHIEQLLDEATTTIREVSFKLSPHILLNYGIIEALNAYIDKVKTTNDIDIVLNHKNLCRFSENIETILYRVVCESITNTIKHAMAKMITINLSCNDKDIEIIYKDDGHGFDVNKSLTAHQGIGLINMQSRIKSIDGILHLNSSPGNGIRIEIKIPLA